MRQLPEFITFTGVGDDTQIPAMLGLARLYPIEWGVLFSSKRQGREPRYPAWDKIQALAHFASRRNDDCLTLAAHICGNYSSDIMNTGQVRGVDAVLGRYFRRAQVNHKWPEVGQVADWALRCGVRAVLQHQSSDYVPTQASVDWLFDASGGRGIAPEDWPMARSDEQLCGFAGGLNADNVVAAVNYIGRTTTRYWLDIESGVRDDNDRFSLEKCRAVCEAVYGKSLFDGAS